jgi:excisionase family DNA binding protein
MTRSNDTSATHEPARDPDPSPLKLLSVREVARLLGCSPRHVYRMVDRGKMPPAVKLGNLNRWSVETIEDWIRAGCPSVRKFGRG